MPVDNDYAQWLHALASKWLPIAHDNKIEGRESGNVLKLFHEGNFSPHLNGLLTTIQQLIRKHDYTADPSYDATKYHSAIAGLTAKPGPLGMDVVAKKNWHQRYPNNRRAMGWSGGDDALERASLNVYPSSKLIEDLDAFCYEHKATYKTPDQSDRWQARHDTVTVYFHESITPEIKQKLIAIASPHVRGNNLIGHKIAEGITVEREPNRATVDALIERGNKLHPEIGTAIRSYALDPETNTRALSTSQVKAVEDMLANYEQHIAHKAISPRTHTQTKATPAASPPQAGDLNWSTIKSTPEGLRLAEAELQRAGCEQGTHYVRGKTPEGADVLLVLKHTTQGQDGLKKVATLASSTAI